MKKFIILGSGRCGSEMMMRCLAQHPEISSFGEIFCRWHPSVDRDLFDNFIEYDMYDLEKHKQNCRKSVCIEAHKKYDCFKLLFGHIHNDVEEYLSKTKVVLLLRNPFKIAVSSLVADATRIYCGKEEFEGTIHIPLEVMEKRIQITLKEVKYYKPYADLVIHYEDDFQDNYDRVCDLANVGRFTPEIRTVLRIARPLSEVIENYEEIKHLDRDYDF